MSETVLPHPSMVERLVELGRRLRTLRRPAEAAELLKIAAALTPHGADLREEAARLHGEEGIDDFDREFKRRNLEASHALGMAHIFETRGEFARAVDMIDLAKLRTPFNYLAYAAAGYLHMRHGDAETALTEFTQARRLNPLDYRLAIETSRAALENEDFEAALESAIDAMLLATWRSEREQHQEQRRVETLVRLSEKEPAVVEKLMATRISTLQKACDHVALSHAKIFSQADLPPGGEHAASGEAISDDLLQRANELRTMGLFRHFSDELLIPLAKIVGAGRGRPEPDHFHRERRHPRPPDHPRGNGSDHPVNSCRQSGAHKPVGRRIVRRDLIPRRTAALGDRQLRSARPRSSRSPRRHSIRRSRTTANWRSAFCGVSGRLSRTRSAPRTFR